MADENTNTAETAASQNTPETGVTEQPKDAIASVAASIAEHKNSANDDLSEKLGMWKHQARENEQKMHENRDRANAAEAKLADTEGALAKANVQIARLKAQKQHPEITDEAFDTLCKETDPEKISEWADAFVKFMPSKTETVEAKQKDNSDDVPCEPSPELAKELQSRNMHVCKPKSSVTDAYNYGAEHSKIEKK